MKKWIASLTLMLAIPALPVAAEEPIPAGTQMIDSTTELQAAKQKIAENREAFGIPSIATRQKENAIVVTAKDWDVEKKAALVNCAEKMFTFHYPTNTLAVGAEEFILPAAPELRDGRLYVPVIDCLAIQYYLGNRMDTFDIYRIDANTISVRME